MFLFQKAKELNIKITNGEGFSFLSPLMQGRAMSSLGQSLSIAGDYSGAEKCFLEAIKHINASDLPDGLRYLEVDQTTVYRAMNAMDGNIPNLMEILAGLLGDFEKAIETMAQDASPASQYHHHLLLRALYFIPSLNNYAKKYVQFQNEWQVVQQHPWELICMYRALLLFEVNNDDDSANWFLRGVSIASAEPHGAILSAIAAVIAKVARCCFELDEGYELLNPDIHVENARHVLMNAPQLCEILNKSDLRSGDIKAVITALPFNYH
jgi:tetratricopeptide (TPR) repeat protein